MPNRLSLTPGLGITPYVFGVSGRQWNDIPRQAEKLQAEHGDDVDAILIFMGTNDYFAGVPIGTWFTERHEKVVAGIMERKRPVDRMRRYPSTDADTYRGRINIAIDDLKKRYPTKQIVLLTPLHRGILHCRSGPSGRWLPRGLPSPWGRPRGSDMAPAGAKPRLSCIAWARPPSSWRRTG